MISLSLSDYQSMAFPAAYPPGLAALGCVWPIGVGERFWSASGPKFVEGFFSFGTTIFN